MSKTPLLQKALNEPSFNPQSEYALLVRTAGDILSQTTGRTPQELDRLYAAMVLSLQTERILDDTVKIAADYDKDTARIVGNMQRAFVLRKKEPPKDKDTAQVMAAIAVAHMQHLMNDDLFDRVIEDWEFLDEALKKRTVLMLQQEVGKMHEEMATFKKFKKVVDAPKMEQLLDNIVKPMMDFAERLAELTGTKMPAASPAPAKKRRAAPGK